MNITDISYQELYELYLINNESNREECKVYLRCIMSIGKYLGICYFSLTEINQNIKDVIKFISNSKNPRLYLDILQYSFKLIGGVLNINVSEAIMSLYKKCASCSTSNLKITYNHNDRIYRSCMKCLIRSKKNYNKKTYLKN